MPPTSPRWRAARSPSPGKDLVYRKAGWISPILLVDGEIAGVREHTEARGELRVEIRPFAPIADDVAARVAAEATRLGAHLGFPVHVGFVAASRRKNS